MNQKKMIAVGGALLGGLLFAAALVAVFAPGDPYHIPNTLRPESQELLASLKADFDKHIAGGSPVTSFYRSETKDVDLSLLPLSATDVVADLGCGTGGLEMRLLEQRVGFAKLYAVDIDPKSLAFLDYALQRASLAGASKVTTVLSEIGDIKIPPGELDVVVTFNTKLGMRTPDQVFSKTHLAESDSLYSSIKSALKPGALTYVFEPVEYKGSVYPRENIPEPFLRHGFEQIEARDIQIVSPKKTLDFYYFVCRRPAQEI
jgi:SAM-dependent methyltransferase